MSQHENEARLLDYLDGTLSPADQADLEAHCRSCPECRAALESAREAHQALRGLTLRPGPDLTAPIMERVCRLPVPTAESPTARPWLPFVLVIGLAIGGALALLSSQEPARPSGRAPGALPTGGEPTHPTPPVATPTAPTAAPVIAPPTLILARAEGSWQAAGVRVAEAVPDGTRLQTGPDGRLELACIGRRPPAMAHEDAAAPFATLVLLPESAGTIEAGALRLNQGAAWLRASPPPPDQAPLTIRHGDVTIHAHEAQAGLAITPDGLQGCVFSGALEIATQPSGRPLTVPSLTALRLEGTQVRLEPLATAAAAPWLPCLDPGLRYQIASPPSVASAALEAPDAVRVAPAGAAPVQASATAATAAHGLAEPATGPGPEPSPASAVTDLDETLLHHQPASD
ncbi:MAG: hypothetical protein OZSIB_4137 [Candidatus Ozemobacter sibiricus]|jgi:anti-sigma factor RsiW|uniref:Putative zinc-finger domain-containing protein n=1 Tax=Candidatus Ozemobacter sibiricus TaxID=2268124 RepID=A0A367ZNF9_9BACT|nr:MAG: hypothetical protein OZSIB_4137 [Candidatus Ozemobacter sibiricus]